MSQSKFTIILSSVLLFNTLPGQAGDARAALKKYGNLFMQSLLAGGSFGAGFGGYAEAETYSFPEHAARHGLGWGTGCAGVFFGSRVMAQLDQLINALRNQTTKKIPKRVLAVCMFGYVMGFLTGKTLIQFLFKHGSQVEIDWDAVFENAVSQTTTRLVVGNSSFYPPPLILDDKPKPVMKYKKRIPGPVGVSIADTCSLPPRGGK